MYKTSFWGVLTSLVAFVLKAVAFFCFIQPLAHFPAQAFGFDMRQASISQQLPFLPSLWAAIFFLILGILQYFCIIYVTLTSAFVQSIGLIEPKRKCVLLCLSLPSALWWCFAWQLVFYCGQKKGLLTRFLRPYFAHSNLHGPFAFWMMGCTALTQSHYGRSHISNTFAS